MGTVWAEFWRPISLALEGETLKRSKVDTVTAVLPKTQLVSFLIRDQCVPRVAVPNCTLNFLQERVPHSEMQCARAKTSQRGCIYQPTVNDP